MIQSNTNRNQLLFYDLLSEAEDINELNASIENLTEAFGIAIQDLCFDMDFNADDVIYPYV